MKCYMQISFFLRPLYPFQGQGEGAGVYPSCTLCQQNFAQGYLGNALKVSLPDHLPSFDYIVNPLLLSPVT